jgi:trehalose 6-phosphate phosphatase
MKNLLTKSGIQVFEAFCYANSILAFDYDGTLAPIVDDPKIAKMASKTRDLLAEIAQYFPVAIISGRQRSDIVKFVKPCNVDYIVGNRGIEGLPSSHLAQANARAACEAWHVRLQGELTHPGVEIENKVYSIAIHYRLAANKKEAKAKILELAAILSPPPRILIGKCVINLASACAPHKGVALLEVMADSGCQSAVYIGDDINDEDAFGLTEESILTVRVGKTENSSALYYIAAQEKIDAVLTACLDAVSIGWKPIRRRLSSNTSQGSNVL